MFQRPRRIGNTMAGDNSRALSQQIGMESKDDSQQPQHSQQQHQHQQQHHDDTATSKTSTSKTTVTFAEGPEPRKPIAERSTTPNRHSELPQNSTHSVDSIDNIQAICNGNGDSNDVDNADSDQVFDEFAAMSMMLDNLEATRKAETVQEKPSRRSLLTRQAALPRNNQKRLLRAAAEEFERCMTVKTHRYRGKAYQNTFVGSDAVDFLLASKFATTRTAAVQVGRSLMGSEFHLFRHVTGEHDFEDNFLFYEFTSPSERPGYDPEDPRWAATATATATDESSSKPNKPTSLHEIADILEAAVPIKDRIHRLRTYKSCFLGRTAISKLVETGCADTREEAVELGNRLSQELYLFERVAGNEAPPHILKERNWSLQFPSGRSLRDITRKKNIVITPTGPQLEELAKDFRENVDVSAHVFRFKKYNDTFVGSEAVDWLVNSDKAPSRKAAVALGRKLCDEFNLFHHVPGLGKFSDDFKLYRFDKGLGTEVGGSSGKISHRNEMLRELATAMQEKVVTKDRRRLHKFYKNSFYGSDAVSFLLEASTAETREVALALGREIGSVHNAFQSFDGEKELEDDRTVLYRFIPMILSNFSVEELTILRKLADAFLINVKVKDRRHRMRLYHKVFVGKKAVDWLVSSGNAMDREDAVEVAKRLQRGFGLFEHVTRDHDFKDGTYFYRFLPEKCRRLWLTPEESEHMTSGEASLTWEEKIVMFENSSRRSKGYSDAVGQSSMSNKFLAWASNFRRLDPRWRILEYFNEVAQIGVDGFERGEDLANVHPLLRFVHRASVFSVWRPTRSAAIQKMMRGEGVGKGLDIKGKSAIRGTLAGFVPFLQISENRHKVFIRPLSKSRKVRLFFGKSGFEAREQVARRLEEITMEMEEGVQQQNQERFSEIGDRSIMLEMTDSEIEYIDDHEPSCYGLEVPVRLFWEAFVMRQDIYAAPGSEYDSGRASMPAFQDYNNAAIISQPATPNGPKAVVYQMGTDPFNPHELVMAYEEEGRVLPVVSDFDGFLVGTRRVHYDPVNGTLPQEQLDILKWCVQNVKKVLDAPTRPESWTNRWVEVLSEEREKGFHPRIPQFGFGDPRSYGIMEMAVNRLTGDGAVRHGAESFNYYFPQEVDEEYLVVSDTLQPVPWTYMDVQGLQRFLAERVEDGFTFPLNPKWIMCDPGWKELYDKLLASDNDDIRSSMEIWFPPEIRAELEAACAKHPYGFEREIMRNSSHCTTLRRKVELCYTFVFVLLSISCSNGTMALKQFGVLSLPHKVTWKKASTIPFTLRGGSEDVDISVPPASTQTRLEGVQAFEAGNFDGAAGLFAKASDLVLETVDNETESFTQMQIDEYATCRLHQALCLLKTSQFEACQDTCTDVIDNAHSGLSPSRILRAKALYRRAKARMQLEDSDGALLDAQAAMYLGDNKATVLYHQLSPPKEAVPDAMSLFDSMSGNTASPLGMASLLGNAGNPMDMLGGNMAMKNLEGMSTKLMQRLEDPFVQSTICALAKSLDKEQVRLLLQQLGLGIEGDGPCEKIVEVCHSVTPRTIQMGVGAIKFVAFLGQLSRRSLKIYEKYQSIFVLWLVWLWAKRAMR
eukprot:Nitzschia sp. Nitz4//scaffold136_size62208//53331//58820//NITZ4_006378-RA/size62208-processed-gene-0.42-mRNA-1//-1//CDS//3329535648//4611//frame0